MKVQLFSATVVLAAMASMAGANTTIVDENFDSYANTTAFEAVWTPDGGNGTTPIAGPVGILVPDLGSGLEPPNDDPPGLEGKGVDILDDINEYNGPNVGAMANLVPSDTESIRLTGDIFDDAIGNKRTSIGLRNDTVFLSFGNYASNIVEMGFYNANTFDPYEPEVEIPGTGYAYRTALFGARSEDILQAPNWQYFQLDPVLDVDGGGLVSMSDIGPGWHRYETIITPTDITFSIDLFRDGVANVTRDGEGNIEIGVGQPGVDATVTWEIAPANNAEEPNPFDPFTSLRIGAPSGITGNYESVVDNILLELVDVVASENADFDADGDIDGKDFIAWQQGYGILAPNATLADGDANGDLAVDGNDLAIWQAQFGNTAALATTLSAVPEPSSAVLLLLAVGAMLIGSNRPRP